MKLIPKLFLLLFFIYSFVEAQNKQEKEFITVVPGEIYKAGGLHKFLFGEHWRDLWTLPVEAEILDLEKFDGGLIPTKRGGGQQTKSLHFYSKNGKYWKFRSIDKDPAKVLPDELRETLVSSILQDQISSANPFAPLIVAPILSEVGILQAEPKLVFMPDSPMLGEYKNEFGNLLGMIELHPDDINDEVPGFEGADKVKSTLDLFERLEKEPEEKIDAVEFLKARLVDVLLGDWDRHTDQWKWVRYKYSSNEIWKPVPRDRDQAFSKFDGVFPRIAEYILPQLNTFDDEYPPVEKITWNGRFVDRHFLTGINKFTWDSVTAFVHNKLTDEVIETAVKVMPSSQFENAGNEIINKLKARRNKLFIFSNEYYNFINKYLDIFCTDKEDSVFVNRIDNLNTEVKVFSKEKKKSAGYNILYYNKIFNNEITKDIRIHLLKEDDKVFVTGNVDESPIIRFIGGEGEDYFEDSSIVNGYFLSVTPFPEAENRTRFYDSGEHSVFKTGPSSFVNRDNVSEPENQIEKYEPALRDRGHHWRFIPVLSFDSDNGLIIGVSPFVKKHNFRADPYEFKMSFTAMYAAIPKSTSFGFSGDFPQYIKNAVVKLDAELTELRFTKYFGYGNETSFSKDLYNDDFYKLDQELFFIKPSVDFSLSKSFRTSFGLSYNYWESQLSNKILISNFPYQNSGLGNMKVIGFHSGFEYNSLNNQNEPSNGLQINSAISYYPEVWQVDRSFVKGSIDAKTFLTSNSYKNFTLALRAGAAKIWGHYPFFEGVFLGGPDNLRGYSRDRFAGDSFVFGKAELRTYLTEVKIILKGKLGFHVFGESGRVFAQGEDSEKWHPSYGGGLWISYLNSGLVGAAYIAGSPEGLQYYLNVGFGF